MEEITIMIGVWFAWAAGIAFGWWCHSTVRNHIEECIGRSTVRDHIQESISRYHREKGPEAGSQGPEGDGQKNESTAETRRHGEKTADKGLMNQTPANKEETQAADRAGARPVPAEVKTRAAATAGKKERTITTTPDRTAVARDIVDRWLERYRKDNGCFYSKRKLAKEAGYHENLFYQWKAGTYKPTWKLIRAVADVFGVTVDEFIAGPEGDEILRCAQNDKKAQNDKNTQNDGTAGKPEAAATRQITPQQELGIAMQHIGAQLDRWMTAKVKSHDDVSSATGISRADLTRLIDNQIRATGDEIYRLAGTFRVTVDDFLAGPTEEDDIADDGDVKTAGESRYELHI
jgi:transcriptional regulator with XRE-family HTH domain